MTDPIRETLTNLRNERADVEQVASKLTVELSKAQTRLGYLDGAIENLQQLLPAEDSAEEDTTDAEADVDEGNDPEPADAARWEFKQVSVARRKYPSTTMVSDLILELDRPVHRDEIVHLFAQRYGIPKSWNNPRNTLGNALLRAWENGSIVRVDQDQFAPRGFRGVTAREVRE